MINFTKYNQQKYRSKKKKAKKILKSFQGKESSIEKKVREFLQEEGIFAIREWRINKKFNKIEYSKVYDFYVSGINEKGRQFDFLIEVDGGYWHGNDYLEGKVPYSKLTKIQKKNIKNDKLKNKLAKEMGFPLLRLKEKDVKYNFEEVKKQIYDLINFF